jgi:hypothetical protein
LDAAGFGAQELATMVFDVILALVFLAMVVAPAVITMPPSRDERDSL